jgi:hypothetical protein
LGKAHVFKHYFAAPKKIEKNAGYAKIYAEK